jgi:hypothetical protein
MGWSGGGDVLEALVTALRQATIGTDDRRYLLVEAIRALEREDADTLEEVLDAHENDTWVVRAFRECGYKPYRERVNEL